MDPGDEARRVGHGTQVGADIDRVGDEQQPDEKESQPGGVMAAKVAGEPVAGGAADPRADHLHGRHQRVGEDHRPAEAVAELRTGLAVGRDATGIVVGCAGDQARSEDVFKAKLVRLVRR